MGVLRHHAGAALDGLRAAAVALRGRSPADISMAVREARRAARKARRPMTGQDIVRLARAALPHRTADADRRVAVHEAGHAIAILALGRTLKSVDLDAAKSHIRFDLSQATREDVEKAIVGLLAGRAADELYGAGADTGAESDLGMSTTLALSVVCRYGLADSLLVVDELRAKTDQGIQDQASAILDACMDEARAILRSRALEHSALVEALIRHRYLDVDEVREILDEAMDRQVISDFQNGAQQ